MKNKIAILMASLILLLCILSVSPTRAAADRFLPFNLAPGPDGNIYVRADGNASMTSHILVFTPEGRLVKMLDRQVWNLAFDDAGNLYVQDVVNNRNQPTIYNITRLDLAGNDTILWSNAYISDRIMADMTVSPAGVVYFSTVSAVQNQSVGAGSTDLYRWEIDAIAANGTLSTIRVINTTQLSSDGFNILAVDGNGTLYTSGIGNRITTISPNGTTGTIGKLGSANGTFNWIYDIAIGPDGYLYVAELGNKRVQKLTTDGTYVAKWDGCGPDPFMNHCGLAIDANGRVYVADEGNQRIVWFTPGYVYGPDKNENLKGQSITWGSVYAGTNYTTRLLEQQFEELQNRGDATPVPGYAASGALIGICLGAVLYCVRKDR